MVTKGKLGCEGGTGINQELGISIHPLHKTHHSPAILRLCPLRACHCPGPSLWLFLELQTPCDRGL